VTRAAAAALRVVLSLALLPAFVGAQAPAPASTRALTIADIDRIATVRDPQRSPDGQWVAYTVGTVDVEKDKTDTDLWMVSWDGAQRVRLTSSPEAETTPRWSPDGAWLAFQRPDDKKKSQVWRLNRLGGEAEKVTDLKGGVSDFVWSPDGTRLLLVAREVDPDAPSDDKTDDKAPKPLVIDTFKFKRDGVGYLDDRLHTQLHIWDIAAKASTKITTAPYDHAQPVWAPNGRLIAFVSAQAEDRDRTPYQEVYVMEPRAGAAARRLTTHLGRHNALSFSPDSTHLAFLQGREAKYYAYDQATLAVVPVAGGPVRLLTRELDRPVSTPTWSPDGSRLLFLLTDDREQHVASVPVAGGAVTRLTSGTHVVTDLSGGVKDGHLAVVQSTRAMPGELFALEGGTLRPLTAHNEWVREVKLGQLRPVAFTSPDGASIHGLVTLPAEASPGARLPMVLQIHGGPAGQDNYGFFFDREWLASHGYAVLQVNYRGSNGRGTAHQEAIFADWGNKEVVDLLAGVDWAVKEGIADPDRLGIGGWSYGGILTNYTIATDTRFKAAVSGAGSSLQLSMYGTDQYVVQYEAEMGKPWESIDRWMKVSYPFFKVAEVKTPTLFMTGEKDFNVPAIGSEQMYQAFKSAGITTRLIIYPGQYHGITRPSYRRHRLEQWAGWFNQHIKGEAPPASVPTATR
jgi:dipeptidyl aminopeptidase/acylaminoacyl peptidase